MTAAIAIISRRPCVPDEETRVSVGDANAAPPSLHAALLHDAIEALAPAGLPLHVLRDPPAAGEAAPPASGGAFGGAEPLPLAGSDLSSDLLAVFRALLPGRTAVVTVRGDVPGLDASRIERALAALQEADVVFGPCRRGGYYLVAMRRPHDLFTGIALGTSVALAQTLARARSLGLRVALLDPLEEVESAGDLRALAGALRPTSRAAALLREPAPDASPDARPIARRLHLEITNRCAARCPTCARSFAPPAERDLSAAEVDRILAQTPAVHTAALQVNGEPLLAPGLLDVLRSVERRGVAAELNTSGLLLDGPIADALLAGSLRALHVSLDAATAATYRVHRGADDFDTVVRNVERFLAARTARGGRGPRVSLWMVATRRNLAELPDLVRLAARLRADEVFVQRLVLHGRGLGAARFSLHGRLGDAERGILDEAAEIARTSGVALGASGGGSPAAMLAASPHPRPWTECRRPWESAVVLADGELVPCCIATFLPSRAGVDIRMGNVLQAAWDAVFEGPRYAAFRRDLRAGIDGPCSQCGVRWSL